MKQIKLTLTVPDNVDPIEVVDTMGADFFYGNRHTYEERFPDQDIMSQIFLTIDEESLSAQQNQKETEAHLIEAMNCMNNIVADAVKGETNAK
jgi:hypothetical protein